MPAPVPLPPGDPFGRDTVTGLVLAGGRGSRMGGVDKGLQAWHGRPLVDHVLDRFAPQVGPRLISANRHADDYARRGARVLADDTDTFDGPLAGLLAGLRVAATAWLAVVPCDAPRLPRDLVARLHAATTASPGAAGAFAVHHEPSADGPPVRRAEPLFCLLRASPAMADALAGALARGERKVDRFLLAAGLVPCAFDAPGDAGAFDNFNRLEDLSAAP